MENSPELKDGSASEIMSSEKIRKDSCPSPDNIVEENKSSLSKKQSNPAPKKTLFLFSNIFEKQEDIKNKPFVFEKHNLKKR